MLWRMAWRNLWRHRGRTIIMTSAVALTYALMLVGMGINDDGHRRMLEEAARAAGGQVIVHAAEYWNTRASDLVIRDAASVVERVRAVAGVRAVMPRVLLNGLVSTAAGTQPVFLQGVDPRAETALRDPAVDLVAGTFLTGGDRDGMVLGARLVEELELELGGRVVLTASDADGEVTRALFHLSGIIATGTRELDEVLAYTTVAAARGAVAMDGMLTQIGVVGEPDADPIALARAIAAALRAVPQNVEVLPWQEAVPEMVGFTELDDAFGYVYVTVIFLVVLFSIANTFLMAVLERVRELGLLSALGLRGQRLARLLLAETALMTLLAMGLGFAVGFGGHLAADHWGIPLSAWGLEEIEISGVDLADLVLYSEIRPVKWLLGSALVAGATITSALYPAWRATRLAPAEAMRFFE
jgi:ABC-type lipoprotein release transport system permease subunit